jgi:hypothetical protein
MAITIQKVTLWRREARDVPGSLADTLEPLAGAGANLRVVMGYGIPGSPGSSIIEVFPVSGKKAGAAAVQAGLAASAIPCLHVEGDDQPGLGARLARAIAARGVNISFLVAETVGRKFSAVFGFGSEADAGTAAQAMQQAAKPAARPAARPKAKARAKARPRKKA